MRPTRKRLGFLLAWSQVEPWRAGEVGLAPVLGRPGVVGRGDAREDDEGERITWQRLRPGSIETRPALSAAAISRQHLWLRQQTDGLEVRCVGRLPMTVNEHDVTQAMLRPGDLLQIDRQLLLLCVERAPSEFASHGVAPGFPFGEPDAFGLVGESPRTWQLRDELTFFARRSGHALLQGPSGAGKELCARAIHLLSERRDGPFLARNAATLPPGIIDAELFGNARNYPNPGMRERPGLVGEADRGTLFLDELGELPFDLQAHLLRLLDDGDYHRLGEELPRKANVRVVVATNRGDDSLKHDLLARLKLRLTLPGLDERRDDIPLLVRALLRRIVREDPALRARFCDGEEARLAPDLLAALIRHRYTAHVRELESLLYSAMADSREHFVALTPSVERRLLLDPAPAPLVPAAAPPTPPSAEQIEAALSSNQGNISRAWRELGLSSRDALNRLIKKYNITPRRP
jgi:DNA-binding NtrC family response regulator